MYLAQFSVNLSVEFFGQIFDQMFGQEFDQGLGEGKNHKYSVQYYSAQGKIVKNHQKHKKNSNYNPPNPLKSAYNRFKRA